MRWTLARVDLPDGTVQWQVRDASGNTLWSGTPQPFAIEQRHLDPEWRRAMLAIAARAGDQLALVADATPDQQGAEFEFEFLEGEETRDGGGFSRIIDEGGTNFDRPTPLPLMATRETTAWGHEGAVLVGIITELERDGTSRVVGRGRFDIGDEALEYQRLVNDGMLTWHSPDLGAEETEFECTAYDEEWGWCDAGILHFTDATLLGTTIIPFQALDSARIRVTAVPGAETGDDTTEEAIAAGALTGENLAPASLLAQARAVVVAAAPAPADVARVTDAPPSSWFEDPGLTGPTAPIVEPSGRTYGHIATWGTCHIGFPDACVEPPHSESGYAYFHTGGHVTTADGSRVRVGHLTVGTGHAPTRGVSADAAAAHYDNTGAAVADVRVGEDEHGIWFSGMIRPDATDEQIWSLEVSALSGDWRSEGGALELRAALAVNVPGFPIPDVRSVVADGACQTLVAAGVNTMAMVASAQRPSTPAPPESMAQLVDLDRRLSAVELIAFPLQDAAVEALTARAHKAPPATPQQPQMVNVAQPRRPVTRP